MKKKQWLIVGSITLLIVIAVLLCVVFLQPKAIEGTVTDCQYPFYCQNGKDGILVIVKGEFSENSWQISDENDEIIAVTPVKLKKNYASYLVKSKGADGYTVLALTLSDGSEQEGFQILISFLVDVYGNLTVGQCSYQETSPVLSGSGELGDVLYSYTLSQNIMELNLQGSSNYQWTLLTDFPDAFVIGPLRSYPASEVNEEVNSDTSESKTPMLDIKDASDTETGSSIESGAEVRELTDEEIEELFNNLNSQYLNEDTENLIDQQAGESQAAESVDTFTISGCSEGKMTVCSKELNLALVFTISYDENNNLIVSETETVPYDMDSMDEEILNNKEMEALIGEKAMFAGLNPIYYGVEGMYSYQMAEMSLSIEGIDWYCEIAPGLSATDFCSARSYEGAENQESKAGEQTVILSVIEGTVTVFWEQDDMAFRITGQSECTTEEALKVAETMISALK